MNAAIKKVGRPPKSGWWSRQSKSARKLRRERDKMMRFLRSAIIADMEQSGYSPLACCVQLQISYQRYCQLRKRG